MSLRGLDLDLLLTLDALLAERSVTAAGRRLSLSQPAVSARLARLREAFGDRLFLATRRGLSPTPRALEIEAPLRQALDALGGLLDSSPFDPSSAIRRFRIAASDALHAAVTVPLAAALQATCPGLSFALLTPDLASLDRRLTAGEIDLALATPSLTPASARNAPLFADTFRCVARPGHPAFADGLTLDAFCAADHLLVSPEGGGFRGAVDGALDAMGRRRRVRLSVPSFLLVPDLLRRSDLVATVPARMAGVWSGSLAQAAPPLDVPPFPVSLCWSPRVDRDPGHAWLRARLVESCAAQGQADGGMEPAG